MDILELDAADLVETFERSSTQQTQGRWMLAGAFGLIVVAVLGFVFCLATDVDPFTLQMLTTLPFMISLGLLTAGWSLSRGATRVTTSQEGLELDQAGKLVTHTWGDIGWCMLTAIPPSQRRQLNIYDANGRRLAVLGEAFDNFDRLVAVVKSHVDLGENSVGRAVQLKKARKSARFIGGGSLFCLAVAILLGWFTYEEWRSNRLLESQAVEGEAVIDRLFLAPNGRTTRIEYTVTNSQGTTGSRNAEITPSLYEELNESQIETIPVLFVDAEPKISRLTEGEVNDEVEKVFDSPLVGYGMSALMILAWLLCLGLAALQWKGWDLDLDSKTGQLSIKRFGEGE